MFDQTCKSCGQRFARGARFCPHCGVAAGGGHRKCDYCGAEMASDAKFCPSCGRSTQGGAPPAVHDNTWARGPEDFATRLEVDDLEGLLRRDLIVQPGTQAILLVDGRSAQTALGPGRYNMRSVADLLTLPSLRRHVTVLLVDTGEVDLDLTISDIFTTDPLKISVDCHVTVGVENPFTFITNLLKGSRSYSLSQLRAYLYDEIQDAAQECVGQRSAMELHRDLALKQQFAMHIEAHLGDTLKQTGLRFSRVRTVTFRHARLSEQAGQQEEYFLQLTKEEADLEHRKRLFDVYDQTALQELFEEERKTEQFERRSLLRERMRRAVMSDRFAELTGEREMEQFLREQDRSRLIADDEWDRIRRAIQWKRDDEQWARSVEVEDRERTRAQLVARLEMENEYERKSTQLLQQQELSAAELRFQLDHERQRVEGEQAIEAMRQLFRLEQARKEAEFRRMQQQAEDAARRERELQDEQQRLYLKLKGAQTDAEVAAIQREIDRLDAELGIALLEKMKAVRRRDEEERANALLRQQREAQEIALLGEERRLAMQMKAQQQAHEQQMAHDAQAQQYELERLGRLKDLPAAALVASAGPEQGRIIADMQRTEAMKGMSEQQILAMVASNSPEAARALAEIARAASDGKMGQEQVAMYERLLEQNRLMLDARDRAAQQVADAYKDAAQRTKDIAEKALDSQRQGMTDIARATSHPPAPQQPPTVVVTGPGGMPTVVGGQPGAAQGGGVQCRRCGTMSPVGTRFCQNCGYEFFAPGTAG